jgi:predicted RNase H-like HicB family nuclease
LTKKQTNYIGLVPELPSAHTQAASLDELHKNLQDVIGLVLEEISEDDIKNQYSIS